MNNWTHSEKFVSFLEVLLYSFCWVIGFLGPFQLMSRSRKIFENFNLWDGLLLIIPILIAMDFENRFPNWSGGKGKRKARWKSIRIMMFIGLIGSFIVNFVSMLYLPALKYPNQVSLPQFFGPVEIHVIALFYGLIIGFGLITWTSMIHSIYMKLRFSFNQKSKNDKKLEISTSLLIGAIFLLLINITWKNANNVYLLCTILSGFGVFVLALFPDIIKTLSFKLPPADYMEIERSPKKISDSGIYQFFGGIIEFLLIIAVILGSSFFFFEFLADPVETNYMTYFLINILWGCSLHIIIIYMKIDKKIRFIIQIILTFVSVALVFYFGISGQITSVKYYIIGIPLVFSMLYYMWKNIQTKIGLALLGLFYLIWLGIAYLSFIPMHMEELDPIQSWIYYVILGIALFCIVISYKISKLTKTPCHKSHPGIILSLMYIGLIGLTYLHVLTYNLDKNDTFRLWIYIVVGITVVLISVTTYRVKKFKKKQNEEYKKMLEK
jgi:hypothetical protein